jgi:hypothetical protein
MLLLLLLLLVHQAWQQLLQLCCEPCVPGNLLLLVRRAGCSVASQLRDHV